MKPTAFLITWPDSRYKPGACLPEEVEHFQRNYEDAIFTPLYTAQQIGEALMGREPETWESLGRDAVQSTGGRSRE